MSSRLLALAGCAACVLAWAAFGSESPPAARQVRSTASSAASSVRGRPRATSSRIGSIASVAVVEGRIYLVDSENHQVAVGEPGRRWSYFGSIGNAPGELFYPTEIAVSPSAERLAVYDSGNRRLQVFDAAGQLLFQEPVEETVYGLAWRGSDEILMGAPGARALVSISRPRDAEAGSFGTLALPPELSELRPGFRETYRAATNRIRMAMGGGGDTWVAFIHLGWIRHYSRTGVLESERRLDLRGLGELAAFARSVWGPEKPGSAAYLNIDGVQLALVIKDIALDPRSDRPVVLLGNDWIGRLDGSGNLEWAGPVRGCAGSFHRLAVDAGRGVALLTSLETPSLCEVELAELYDRRRPADGTPAKPSLSPARARESPARRTELDERRQF